MASNTASRIIDRFKERTAELQMKKGYCLLMDRHYGTIECRRFCCRTGLPKEQQKAHYIIEDRCGKPVFRILDGTTGYEAYYVEDFLARPCRGWFSACAGTENRWDRFDVNGQEILDILEGKRMELPAKLEILYKPSLGEL
ncbi:MAG: hypothetical protein AAF984_10325 [Verrucomicrobiota bacterium]